jgi:mono/diheme cytochrome c family protein
MQDGGNARSSGDYGKDTRRGFGKGDDVMNRKRNWMVFLAAAFLLSNGALSAALADHDDHKEKKSRKRYLTPVDNATYKEECGACHFVYQPELLPSGSWEKILAGLEDHFGEGVELDPESKRIIAEYLKANAAERSSAKRAVKIMRSLGSRAPLRITDVPYIQEKHHEVSPNVLKRKSIGSLSNCIACHTTAEKGDYDDDNVVIPK